MKGTLSGLKELKKIVEGTQNSNSAFLRLKDGQSVQVRFLQELDVAGKLYDESRGLAFSVYEHSDPDNFRQKFICTSNEEGQCVGCERVVQNSKWRKSSRLYINAYNVDDGLVQIIPTGFSTKGIGATLVEYAEDFGTICDRNFKLKRTGELMKTSYSVFPREVSDFDFSKVEVFELDKIIKYRTYDECLEFLDGDKDAVSAW